MRLSKRAKFFYFLSVSGFSTAGILFSTAGLPSIFLAIRPALVLIANSISAETLGLEISLLVSITVSLLIKLSICSG